jgi:hypothetical protein
MNIYCGNNKLDETLLNGSSIIGTRYKCLRKGIGTGLNMKYDNKYNSEYEPIYDTKIYCGDKETLPENYDSFGNLPQCLQKGVAIGKKQKALKGPPFLYSITNSKYIYYYKFILWLILSSIVFIILYYKKNIFDILLNPYFNQLTSAGMYDYIRTLMMQNIEVDNDPVENNPYNGKIMAFNRSNVVNETVNISNLFHANLLISRINYCILLFAHNHGINIGSPMYLYRLLPIGTRPSRQNIFQPMIGFYNPTQLSNPAVLNNVFIAP